MSFSGECNAPQYDSLLTSPSELDSLTDDFPEDFFKLKILPELQKSVEFGGGGPKVFNAIMKIGAKLSDDEFETRLVPLINRLFSSPDRAIRVCLLDSMHLMIDRIPQKDINGKIFPMLVTGFTDTAPIVREQTVKSVLTIINKLSDRTINGELLRYLAKTANDEQPGIRTNTTICLGKIAKSLGTGSRSKVLIAAFTRSLRDPFVHARSAALMALTATIEFFTDDDCATKILPCICACLLDKEKLVRDQASRTMDSYLQRVRKYASTMAETALPPTENGNIPGAPAARMGNQGDTSWAGWAISSFTNKVGTAKGEMASANGTVQQARSTPASGRATPTLPGHFASERPSATSSPKPRIAQPVHVSKDSMSQPEIEVQDWNDDAMDAWGTMDGDGDSFFDAHSTKKQTLGTGPAVAFDDGGEPDFAGWLAAQSQAKAKTKNPQPKGLSKAATNVSSRLDVRPRPERAASTSAIGKTPPVSKPVSKPIAKPKEPDPTEDNWGDAWD
jgi:SCY1-like protein 1